MKFPDGPILDRMRTLAIAPESTVDTKIAEPGKNNGRKAIFLDRDGLIIEDGYPNCLKDRPRIIDGAIEAISGFRKMGFLIIIITNQGSIGMGRIDHQDLMDVMEYMKDHLGSDRPWDMAYYCPYHPDSIIDRYRDDHIDRKPHPGMILRAALENDIDLSSSIMIGDHLKDVLAGHAAGCKGVIVSTGRGNKEIGRIMDEDIGPTDPRYPDLIAEDLYNAYLGIREGSI